ncbi:ggdef domain protein [Thermosipho africanus TCF52B]|uniref:Ggdef domain protein n=2 Tax=Thermosipho TaxID=2420 RepID=B7IHS1_THEAB|nr:ggdef domain protein [Thermosipho africanus TCF52B]
MVVGGIAIKNKKILSIVSIIAAVVFLILSKRFVFTTIWFYDITFLLLLYFTNLIDLKLNRASFMFEMLVIIPSLLFISPETIALLTPIFYLIFQKEHRLTRLSMRLLMYSFGTYLFYSVPHDYLRIPFFALGVIITNFMYLFFYFFKDIKLYLTAIFNSYVMISLGALLVANVYLHSEIKLSNFILFFLTYSLYLILIILYADSFNMSILEKIEREKLKKENDNFLLLLDLAFKEKSLNFDGQLNKILEVICEISGFETALLSIMDYEKNRVIRVASYGLEEEVFNNLKNQQVNIENVLPLFSKRFEVEGVYFIPEGSISLDAEGVYVFDDYYTDFNYENSWNPKDLLLVPLIDENSRIVGYISFDKPISGRRPVSNELKLLKFLSWFVVQFLRKTPYAKYLISKSEVNMTTYPEFVRLCDSIISENDEASVAFLDIDDFDKINIKKGPEFAEHVSNFITEYFKDIKNVYFYKLNGENFVFFMPNTNKLRALTVFGKFGESLKDKFEDVSTSIGVAYKEPGQNKSFFELLREAKEALLVAKKSGGGRTMIK